MGMFKHQFKPVGTIPRSQGLRERGGASLPAPLLLGKKQQRGRAPAGHLQHQAAASVPELQKQFLGSSGSTLPRSAVNHRERGCRAACRTPPLGTDAVRCYRPENSSRKWASGGPLPSSRHHALPDSGTILPLYKTCTGKHPEHFLGGS